MRKILILRFLKNGFPFFELVYSIGKENVKDLYTVAPFLIFYEKFLFHFWLSSFINYTLLIFF